MPFLLRQVGCSLRKPFRALPEQVLVVKRKARITPAQRSSAAFARPQLLQFLKRSGPVFAQQAAERPVGQELACGLAAGTVVGLVGSIANALDFCAAARARVSIPPVRGHPRTKRSDFLGKLPPSVGTE